MAMMTLTHAVLNQQLDIATANYLTCYVSTNQGCTMLLSTGTTVIPVKETPAQVKELYEQAIKRLHAAQAAVSAPKTVSANPQAGDGA